MDEEILVSSSNEWCKYIKWGADEFWDSHGIYIDQVHHLFSLFLPFSPFHILSCQRSLRLVLFFYFRLHLSILGPILYSPFSVHLSYHFLYFSRLVGVSLTRF